MRAEPPDQLTGAVWQMLADAQTSAMTREEAIEQTILFLRRNLGYLARRERRGYQTSYDELLERDLEAIARLVVLLAGAVTRLSRWMGSGFAIPPDYKAISCLAPSVEG